jgi:hypothetical protein
MKLENLFPEKDKRGLLMKTIEINNKKYIEITKEEYLVNKESPMYIERDEEGPEDFRKIIEYCRNNDYQYIIPNITINGSRMTSDWYDFFVKNMGAVAVSHYNDDNCFNAVKELINRGMKQVNIHKLVSEETFESCMQIIDQVQSDSRLSKLNALVFLMLKQKGRGQNFNRLSNEHYKVFIEKLFESKINFGFDSCGAGRLLKYGVSKNIEKFITPCESTRESCYINVHGEFFPCSFNEQGKGIDMLKINDFIKEVWYNEKTNNFRKELLKNDRHCPIFKI